ncbi:MAG TPA: nuclear transport factor 2 family protein [Burkholderiaceae bacterium]|nr:nuclear transport factor 2 family protein [Burkholderiaceae bacterium]
MTCENEGLLTVLPRDQWFEMVRNRPSPKARGLARHDEILQIDQASPTMAFVKLRCAIPPRFFTDYLSLLKIDGRWQVAQKVYTTEMRNTA